MRATRAVSYKLVDGSEVIGLRGVQEWIQKFNGNTVAVNTLAYRHKKNLWPFSDKQLHAASRKPIEIDGVRYPSKREAAEALGIDIATLNERERDERVKKILHLTKEQLRLIEAAVRTQIALYTNLNGIQMNDLQRSQLASKITVCLRAKDFLKGN